MVSLDWSDVRTCYNIHELLRNINDVLLNMNDMGRGCCRLESGVHFLSVNWVSWDLDAGY